VKIQLLPSSIDSTGQCSPEQRLTCFVVDDKVAIDAGSLGIGASEYQRSAVRDVIITHPHIDHVASLPIFIDDLFSSLRQPVKIYATEDVIAVLERDLFNWALYPRFSELNNDYGPVLEYVTVVPNEEFSISHLRVTAIPVKHAVPTVGLIVSDGSSTIAFSSDTAKTDDFWTAVNSEKNVNALFIESSFPNSMTKLAEASFHLTPRSLEEELAKLERNNMDILAVHLKPSFRNEVINELKALNIPNLQVMKPGLVYEY
jgi:ribonuclease BN (tRNA processing enzyme)